MKEKLRDILYHLYYGTVSAGFYARYRNAILFKNLRMLRIICVMGLILGTVMSVTASLVTALKDGRYFYYAVLVCSLAGLLLNVLGRRHQKSLQLPGFYIIMEFLITVLVIMETFIQSGRNATLFFVVLTILPVFIVDRPGRLILLLLLNGIIFCICTMCFKKPDLAITDLVNCLSIMFFNCLMTYFLIHIQLTEIAHKEQIRNERDKDGLTGLYNRTAAQRRITESLKRETGMEAMLLIDLDHFKEINDTFGHMQGDEILKETAVILRRLYGNNAVIARLGGDEFLVFYEAVADRRWLARKAEESVRRLERRITVDNQTCVVSASVGVAFARKMNTTYDQMYKEADEAMYRAKDGGKNAYALYR